MLKGIDISKWQGTTPNLANLAFIAIRASVGASQDTMWATHYANARKAGLITMAYHYGLPASSVPIKDQAAKFLAVARDADFLWLDQEEAGFDDAQAQQFIDLVRAAGRPCGLYHSSSGFGGVNADAQWVADWRDSSEAEGYPNVADGSKEFPGWELWQYDGAGADGIDNDYASTTNPLAHLLRIGYVSQFAADAAAAEALRQIEALKAKIASLEFQLSSTEAELEVCQSTTVAQAETIQTQAAQIVKLESDLATAVVGERNRIAALEADRIRAL